MPKNAAQGKPYFYMERKDLPSQYRRKCGRRVADFTWHKIKMPASRVHTVPFSIISAADNKDSDIGTMDIRSFFSDVLDAEKLQGMLYYEDEEYDDYESDDDDEDALDIPESLN